MDINGTVIQVLPVVTGASSKGSWSKQDFILEFGDKYPKKVCITLWGQENIDKYDLAEGMEVTASINVESREYNGRWFTDVKAWKIEWEAQKRPAPVQDIQPAREQEWPEMETREPYPSDKREDVPTDDLPF